jgi:hypothetical protein
MRRTIPKSIAVLLLSIASLAARPGFGAEEPLQPRCIEPVRPPDKTDSVAWNRFVDQVDVYRSCMNAFITENHAAADRHRAAANAATETWNQFVHSSLNVPEDFPWPPPESGHAGR